VIIRNDYRHPPLWSLDQLAADAQRSLDLFVDRRLREPKEKFTQHFQTHFKSVAELIRAVKLIGLDSRNPEAIRKILLNDKLFNTLRYVTGPPVSSDDLGVLVTRSVVPISKHRLKSDDRLVEDVLVLICALTDQMRFPWLENQRKPTPNELKAAMRSTAILQAAQSLQTERRTYGKSVENTMEQRLIEKGFKKRIIKNKGKVTSPKDWPSQHEFYGECTVYRRKCDLLIGTGDGRIVAVEAKDSSSVINSVKRVLNDTAAKAEIWHKAAGNEIIPIALLSGVFGVENLVQAQNSGLFIVWSHNIDMFVNWLMSQT
jgi:hypothetical protein